MKYNKPATTTERLEFLAMVLNGRKTISDYICESAKKAEVWMTNDYHVYTRYEHGLPIEQVTNDAYQRRKRQGTASMALIKVNSTGLPLSFRETDVDIS
jgi:hypothetical protein